MSMEMVTQVRDFSKSQGDAKFLLLTIASHINPQLGWAWPSLETLAHEITKGKPYTIKLIRALEALGELEVRRGHGRGHANHYRVTIWHELPRTRSAPADPDQPKGNPSDDPSPEEKVIGGAEKVIEAAEKGNPRGYSKERLERKILETGAREEENPVQLTPAQLQRLGLTPGSHFWRVALGEDPPRHEEGPPHVSG